jgi:hypothetical protein
MRLRHAQRFVITARVPVPQSFKGIRSLQSPLTFSRALSDSILAFPGRAFLLGPALHSITSASLFFFRRYHNEESSLESLRFHFG